jgi:hypothetical protein
VIPIVVVILALLALLVVLFFVPRLLTKRAVRKVVARFRKEGATSPETAKTLAEMRLHNPGALGSMLRFRDYKQYAIRLLGQAQIILGTEEGGVFLSEENLKKSPVNDFAGLE